jgi:short-subunit dehydrogenase
MTMRGKNVLLTGASGSIGAEVARQLAGRGARLALSGRREQRLAALAEELAAPDGKPHVVLPADLGRRGEAQRLAAAAVAALGEVDVLINNAGAAMQGLTWVVGDRDEAREVLETNLWSPLVLVAGLAPQMLSRGDGAIVNVGSMAQVSPFPHLGHYAASRAALAVATQVMQLEMGPRGVRVVQVALGPIDTPASRENRVLAGADRWLDGRPGLGGAKAAAAAIAAATDGNAQGVMSTRASCAGHTASEAIDHCARNVHSTAQGAYKPRPSAVRRPEISGLSDLLQQPYSARPHEC